MAVYISVSQRSCSQFNGAIGIECGILIIFEAHFMFGNYVNEINKIEGFDWPCFMPRRHLAYLNAVSHLTSECEWVQNPDKRAIADLRLDVHAPQDR